MTRHVVNFSDQFAAAVERGAKRQTIRAPRCRAIRPGDELRLYTGLRTKACRLLRVARCTAVTPVVIHADGLYLGFPPVHCSQPEALDREARADGVADWPAMRRWFERTHGLPFAGHIIAWEIP